MCDFRMSELATVNYMEDIVRRILRDNSSIGLDALIIDSNADLYAAGLTSFTAVQFMMALEEKMGVEYPDHLMKRSTFQSVRAIVESVVELQQSRVA